MEFSLNGNNYKIIETEQNEIKEKSECENEKYCFGLTDYTKHIIYIDQDLCFEEKINTLKHELTHCFLNCTGNSRDNYTQEELCDVVANSNFVINSIVDDYRRRKYDT